MNTKVLKNYRDLILNLTAIKQFFSPNQIPFLILNFNQLHNLKTLVDFAISRKFKNIVVIDNLSSYPPLIKYYTDMKDKITVEYMKTNHGPTVLMDNEFLYNKYTKGFFILTDSDITPNPNLPKDFLRTMLKYLILKINKVTKVGFALDIETIPDYYPVKEKVIEWESQFWKRKIEENVYYANIDTTFALYKPNPKKTFEKRTDFLWAIRIGGNFTSRHGGWYLDYNNLTDEQKFYVETSSKSSSWLIKNGKTNQEY